jgi:hypothetical protein
VFAGDGNMRGVVKRLVADATLVLFSGHFLFLFLFFFFFFFLDLGSLVAFVALLLGYLVAWLLGYLVALFVGKILSRPI